MGMYATADVSFGVDLGDHYYGESYVEAPDEYLEDGLGEGLETLFNEYRTELAGPEPQSRWGEGEDNSEWLRWVKSVDGVGYTTYGYEHGGLIVSAGSGGHASLSEPGVLDVNEPDKEALEKFLQFMESKGFKFHEGKRKAQWLVTASYG